MASDGSFTLLQTITLTNVPRVMAAISCLSSLYIIVSVLRNNKYRLLTFHRLMVGMAFNMLLLGIQQVWGVAAVPVGTETLFGTPVYGAHGNTATCTVMGFLNQMGFTVPSYYFCLSIYSFFAVTNNFNLAKYMWIEKWIHIGVYIFPVSSAIYLTTIDAFNYSGHTCWVESTPLGCGIDSDIVCTRGPQNISEIQWYLVGVPVMFLMGAPTVMMIALYIYVRRRQAFLLIEAKDVAKQASLYLAALYWTYIFAFINGALVHGKGEAIFSLLLLSICVENLIGLWIMLVYIRFSGNNRNCQHHVESNTMESDNDRNHHHHESIGEAAASKSANKKENNNNNTEKKARKLSFTIFDGTNPSDVWKNYVFEGDSEDEEEDMLEAKMWEDVVQK